MWRCCFLRLGKHEMRLSLEHKTVREKKHFHLILDWRGVEKKNLVMKTEESLRVQVSEHTENVEWNSYNLFSSRV